MHEELKVIWDGSEGRMIRVINRTDQVLLFQDMEFGPYLGSNRNLTELGYKLVCCNKDI